MGNNEYKNTDIGMIPSEWEIVQLGECAKVTKLAGFEFTLYMRYQDSGKIIALRGLNIKKGRLLLKDVKYIDNSNLLKIERSKLYIDDLLFTYVGTVGEAALVNENDKYYLAPNVSLIRISQNLFPKFALYQIYWDKFIQTQIIPLIATSSQPALTMTNIRKFNFICPSIQEQQKIATALTHIDNLINDYEKLIKKKEAIKKGMMQELFNKNIFNVKMCDVFDIIKGKQINKSTLSKKGKYYVLNGGQQPSGYTDNYNTDENVISISEGGNSCGFVSYNTNKFWAGGHLYVLYLKEKKYNLKYLFHILKYQESLIMNLRKGSGLPNIKKNDLNNFEVPINGDEKEQNSIANILDNIFDEIVMAHNKLNKLKSIKKSMMSNLLTGKIRL